MAIVYEIMGFIDTAVSGAAEGTFVAVASNFGGVITVVATIAFAMFGLAVGLGVFSVRTGDLAQLVLRIILIFTFGLSWANFEVIYDALTNTGDALVTALFSVADGSGATSSVDLAEGFADQAQETAASVIRAESAIARGFLGAIMYLLLAMLQAAYILVAGFAKIMIGILIGLAPFAIAATCLNRTQFLFEAWVSSLIGYFMYPVAAAGVMGFIAAVATQAFGARSDTTLIGITGVVVIIIVGIYALLTIPQIASNITGQLNLGGIAPQALSIVGRPMLKAGEITQGAGKQVLSGATTGGETAQRAAQVRRFGSAMDMKLANAGARLSNNAAGRFVQRRRDVQFARESNERLRAKSKK
ncbi:TrbL/VirB6 plasmid conjugal transfer protein [Primorskyibacter sedentarius]|uniref:TrbL/VirB6 plasmid conjugal transfer protein n=1 Tax=Primorskyibacter sedentarius TaxID=745311 RepID=A0A4R3IW78_9RHOB|nr:type IV secretion system protein [Primorskyibacter sedentarius]TCS55271.1 TrbL/VirB6 plasmid conjugal transfer protein [Primorskyibacter sedentarius]